jgi:hypothetical protein
MGFTMAEKKKIVAEFTPCCRKAGKNEKSRIPDEYPALSGGKSRKYAIFKLTRAGKILLCLLDDRTINAITVEKSRRKRACQPYYDVLVAEMLELLWTKFDWLCGKLFALFLRLNLDLIRLREKYHMSDTLAHKLKKISPRTIDRFPQKPKQRMKIHGPALP